MLFCRLVFIVFALVLTAPCQSVLLLHGKEASGAEVDRIKAISDLLGFNLQMVDPDQLREAGGFLRGQRSGIEAVLVSAEALSSIDKASQDRLLLISQKDHLPVLIFGITSATDPSLLSRWSEQRLGSCQSDASALGADSTLTISKDKRYGPLAGIELRSGMRPACTVRESATDGAAWIISSNSQRGAVFARVGDTFFVPRFEGADRLLKDGGLSSISEVFASVAPFVMFLREVAGEAAWHLDGHYANFTIDDPWLIQPYGNLDYRSLLTAMKQHKFHTTIAFVPWNYDRSRRDVVDLFRGNSNYYSISIHGNNHTHREFGDYRQNPPGQQANDISQAVARMDEFHRLTGIAYDRFMVFPHGVAPEATFGQLRKDGFVGTANSLNVPLDDLSRAKPLDALRPYTNQYQGLLSMFRYSAEAPISESDLAVQAYLGNPILVYAHQEAFRDGNRLITDVVDHINRMVPDVQWMGLGDIARKMYWIRRRADGGYDVAMLSKEATITNRTGTAAMYYVEPPKTSAEIIDARVGNTSFGKDSPLRVEIPAGESRTIALKFAGEAELSGTALDKGGVRAYTLRAISDFRDLYLSRLSMGRSFIEWYYSNGADSFELFVEQKWKYVVGFIVVVCAFIFGVRRASIAGYV